MYFLDIIFTIKVDSVAEYFWYIYLIVIVIAGHRHPI